MDHLKSSQLAFIFLLACSSTKIPIPAIMPTEVQVPAPVETTDLTRPAVRTKPGQQ